jgi:hypothetical protein
MEKLTRRELGVIAAASLPSLASSLAAAKAIAQTPPPAADADFYQAALESHKENSAILAQFQIPMSTEPASHFKA